jgi:hypothetical protein
MDVIQGNVGLLESNNEMIHTELDVLPHETCIQEGEQGY